MSPTDVQYGEGVTKLTKMTDLPVTGTSILDLVMIGLLVFLAGLILYATLLNYPRA